MLPNQILSYVVKTLFPTAKLVSSGSTPLAFHVDVIFETPISREALHLIEERFKAFLAHPEPMKVMEMIPSNAAELLRHYGEDIRAEAAIEMEGPTLFVLKIGNIHDVSEDEPTLDLPYKEVRMVDIQEEDGVSSLWGVVGDVKEKAKAFHHAKKVRYDISGQEIGLFEIDEAGFHWSAKGMQVRGLISEMWHAWMKQLKIQVISTPDFRHYCQKHRGEFAQLSEGDEVWVQEKTLQKLLDNLTDLWKLCGFAPSKDWIVKDIFGNEEALAVVEKKKDGVYISLIESISSLIFASLEHNEGHLPIGLEPIQVSIGLMKQSFDSAAQLLKKQLESEGVRTQIVKNVFKTKHDASLFAKKQNCPYFYLIYEENLGGIKGRDQKKFEPISGPEFVKCVLKSAKKS